MHTVQEREPLALEVYTTCILHCSQEANYQYYHPKRTHKKRCSVGRGEIALLISWCLSGEKIILLTTKTPRHEGKNL